MIIKDIVMLRKILFACSFLLYSFTIHAQDTLRSSKIITKAQLVGFGKVSQLDTYLSPNAYEGGEIRYISHTLRNNGTPILHEIIHQTHLSYTHNASQRNNNIGGMYNFQYNVHYAFGKWMLGNGTLTATAGGGIDANIGFLYNMRNGNNPAQLYLNMNLAPSASATYAFRLWGKPFQVRYEVQSPLVGLMFAPNFGQSYYEIFSKGDYDHNIVPTTMFSTPSLRQMLTLDFTLRHTTLRLGYLGDFQQARVNSLKYHTWSNLFVLGVVRTFSISKIIP